MLMVVRQLYLIPLLFSEFNFEPEYLYEEELHTADSTSKQEHNKENIPGAASEGEKETLPTQQWALLEFEKPVACPRNCLIIGSKLDTDIHILLNLPVQCSRQLMYLLLFLTKTAMNRISIWLSCTLFEICFNMYIDMF